MDTAKLHEALQATLSANNEARRAAEAFLVSQQTQNGFLVSLLQIVNTESVHKALRQSAGVMLKNGLDASCPPQSLHWGSMCPSDKSQMMEHVFGVFMSQTDHSLRELVAEVILQIALVEFPGNWPNLMNQIMTEITNSADTGRMFNALLLLRKLVKKYQWRPEGERQAMELMVDTSFPVLQQIVQAYMNSDNPAHAEILKICCKTYWSAMQYCVNKFVSNTTLLQSWMGMFNTMLAKPLPEASEGLQPAGQPTALEERREWIWWKLKKWIMQIIARFFSRYGNPDYAQKEHQELSKFFVNNIAPGLLGTVMDVLSWRSRGRFCTDRVSQLCLNYVSSAVEPKVTYKLIKPHLSFLMFQVMLPILEFNKNDAELWAEDPHEYVRKAYDPMCDYLDPRTSCINLLRDLVHSRKGILEILMPELSIRLNRFIQSSPNQQASDMALCFQKDGALHALGAIADQLMKKKMYKKAIEGMLVSFVIPDFQSPVGFLRARACWMFQQFAEYQFKSEHNLQVAVNQIIKLLQDPELPTQMSAAIALRFLIESKTTAEVMEPVIPQILTEYFRLMNELGVDEIIAALETIIQEFGAQILPFAQELMTQLAKTFQQLHEDGEDNDESAMAAMTTLECMSTFLQHAMESEDMMIFPKMEVVLLPMLDALLTSGRGMEYFEQVLTIISFFTYYTPQISPGLWTLYPRIHAAFMEYAFDYMSEIVMPFENFIHLSNDIFVRGNPATGQNYLVMACEMIQRTFEHNSGEKECGDAASLLSSILIHSRGKIDHALPSILEMTMKMLSQVNSEQEMLKYNLICVIHSAFFYNATLTLQCLENLGVTNQIFGAAFSMLPRMCTRDEKKVSAIGFLSILQFPANSFPTSVQSGFPQILGKCVEFLVNDCECRREREERRAEKNAEKNVSSEASTSASGFEVDQENSTSDEDEAFGSDDDAVNEEDKAYAKFLEMEAKGEGYMCGFDDSDDESDLEAQVDERHKSPIDKIKHLELFHDTLLSFSKRDPTGFQNIQNALDLTQQQHIQELLKLGQLSKQSS